MTKQGRQMMTGATKDGVTFMTRWHLNVSKRVHLRNIPELLVVATVDGKL